MSTYRKRIPYGMMNFVDVRKDDCYYVDKTRFIPTIEQTNKFYRPESEKDTQGGYADIFMLPMIDIWKDMQHSYIIELKYAKGKDSDEVVARLREEAIAQANRYADTEVVKRNIGTTTLHKIVVVYRGMDMVVCEEIEE